MKAGIDPLLKFVHEYTLEHGYPPAWRDIVIALGVTSTNAIQGQIRVRERHGLISSSRGKKSRTLRVHALGIVK